LSDAERPVIQMLGVIQEDIVYLLTLHNIDYKD